MNLKLKKNVPIISAATSSKYPFQEMNVSDSFFIKTEPTTNRRVKASVSSALNNYKAKAENEKKRFAVRQMQGGVRIWRTV